MHMPEMQSDVSPLNKRQPDSSYIYNRVPTGTGKSNTVYQMLDKLHEQGCKYMVIEPAKRRVQECIWRLRRCVGIWNESHEDRETITNQSVFIPLKKFMYWNI